MMKLLQEIQKSLRDSCCYFFFLFISFHKSSDCTILQQIQELCENAIPPGIQAVMIAPPYHIPQDRISTPPGLILGLILSNPKANCSRYGLTRTT